jgi:hypothetical protein
MDLSNITDDYFAAPEASDLCKKYVLTAAHIYGTAYVFFQEYLKK